MRKVVKIELNIQIKFKKCESRRKNKHVKKKQK
jgi:hypothetical protein